MALVDWWQAGRPISADALNSTLLFVLVISALGALFLFAQWILNRRETEETGAASATSDVAEIHTSASSTVPLPGIDLNEPETPEANPSVVDQTWWKEKYYEKFIGHQEELVQLLEHLSPESTTSVLAIQAIGGMGKTAFCRELIGRAYDRELVTTIAWVRARRAQFGELGEPGTVRDSELTFEDALKDIAFELRLPHWQALDPVQLRHTLTEYLTDQRCLIVIDGLEDADSPNDLAMELSKMLGRSKAILTTRRSVNIAAQRFDLLKLSPKESEDFIAQVSQERFALNRQNPFHHASPAQIEDLVRITDGMPLALKLVISQADYLPIERIIERLQDVSDAKRVYQYIFEDSWEELLRIDDVAAQTLLALLAVRDIPVSVKYLYGLEGFSDTEIDDALLLLRNLSLLEYSDTGGNRQVSLHSLTKQYFNEALGRV